MHLTARQEGWREDGYLTFAFTADGVITSVGSGLGHLLAKPVDLLSGNSLPMIMTPHSAEITMLYAEKLVKLGKPRRFEVALLRNDGAMVPAMLHLSPLTKGRDHWLVASVDLFPEDSAVQEQIIQTEKMAAAGILAAGLTQDIAPPASDLRQKVPMLKEAFMKILPILDQAYKSDKELEIADLDYPTFKKELVDIMSGIESGTEKIAETVDHFRSLFDGGRKRRSTEISLTRNLRICVRLTKELLGCDNIDLEFSSAKDLPHVKGNVNHLQYIFLNILFKAHALLEGKTGRISINAGMDPPAGYIRIEIKAEVTGNIKKKKAPTIFPSAVPLSFGLGSIQKLLREFNGRFGMRSVAKDGTVFQIEIPVSKASPGKLPATAAAANI